MAAEGASSPRSLGSPASPVEPMQRFVVAIICKTATQRDASILRSLEGLREKHDSAFDRWLPHITLVPPTTVSPADIQRIKAALQNSVSTFHAFEVTLNRCAFFPLRGYENIHLRPEGSGGKDRENQPVTDALRGTDELLRLEQQISTSIQALGLSKRKKSSRKFVPHVSVGQSRTGVQKALIMAAARKLANQGMVCTVDRFQLFSKPELAGGPYALAQEFHLAGMRDMVSPYVISTKDYAVHNASSTDAERTLPAT